MCKMFKCLHLKLIYPREQSRLIADTVKCAMHLIAFKSSKIPYNNLRICLSDFK